MALVKQSFISNLIGKDRYHYFKAFATITVIVGTCILAILLMLTYFFHLGFLSSLLNLFTGTSIPFILYIFAIIIVLDIKVNVEEPEDIYSLYKRTKLPKPIVYKLTIVWACILICLGIYIINISNEYRRQYAFECDTFLVDHYNKLYHLNYWGVDCKAKTNVSNLEEMKGFQIKETYRFCPECEDWAMDAVDLYHSDRYSKR